MGGVCVSSNVLEMLDACVVAFESITEFCIAGDEDDSMFGEE
jgi:hypothetical protein